MAKLTAPVALVILDGWGIGKPGDPNDAIAVANTPRMDDCLQSIRILHWLVPAKL